MSEMRQHTVQCLSPGGLHRMAYVEWGDPKNSRVLVCVHGLTRNARDFDFLAKSLSKHYRVVCPDVVGRGRSNWLRIKDNYQLQQYAADMVTLIARLGVDEVHWVGTSMGGLIGMALAAQAPASTGPIQRLILNDVGPVVAAVALRRICDYLGHPLEFASLAEAEAHFRQVAAPFGQLTDAQWHHLTAHVVKTAPNGRLVLRYDPAIAVPFKAVMAAQGEGKDIELWPLYDAIRCPTLIIRGENSDLLTRATVAAMQERGPRALAVEIPNVGHAPMFMDDAQLAVVSEFLQSAGA